MTKTTTAIRQEIKANTGLIKPRMQWMKASAKGITKLGFDDWYNEQLDKIIDSWMTK